jgi:hypothetical protein
VDETEAGLFHRWQGQHTLLLAGQYWAVRADDFTSYKKNGMSHSTFSMGHLQTVGYIQHLLDIAVTAIIVYHAVWSDQC